MKVLVLYGSPHPEGTTAVLLEKFKKLFFETIAGDHEFVLFDAYQEALKPCIGCNYCEEVNGCRFSDGDRLDALYRTCDFMVVASPVYNLSFPAPLKAVLDRAQRYFSARFARGVKPPVAKHKSAVMLLTCGSDSDEGPAMIRSQLTMIFTILNANLIGEVVWKNTDQGVNPGDVAGALADLAEKLARVQVL